MKENSKMNINTNANNRLKFDDSYFDTTSDHANDRNGCNGKQPSIGIRTFVFASSSMWWLCTCLYLVQSIQQSVAFQGYSFFTHGTPSTSCYTGLKGSGNPNEYSHHIFQTQARSLSTRGMDPFPDLNQRSYIHTRGFARMSMKLSSSNDGTDDIDMYRGTVQKRQTAIFDGAEFISIASVLKLEAESRLNESEIINEGSDGDSDDNVSDIIENQLIDEDVPSKMAGYMTFIVANLDSGDRVLGIQTNGILQTDTNADVKNRGPSMPVVKIEENVYVQKDSIVSIPKGVSDSDAISTAMAALAGVRCSFPTNLNILEDDGDDDSEDSNHNKNTSKEQKDFSKSDIVRAVVLGGGDYACFVATAMDSLGADVSLVTTRPMSLKDTPLNPLRNSNVDAMPPSIGDDELGFSDALGCFDTVVDTLGDEADLRKVKDFDDGIDRVFGYAGVSEKLKKENSCQRYISTLTQSQRIVLKEGILFARDPVLQYQKEIEKSVDVDFGSKTQSNNDGDSESAIMKLPAPSNYGLMLQKLFDANIIFPTDRNENGSHKNKKVFVKGCSFPDYAEIEIWPADSTDGASVRYGFPGIADLALEAKVQKMMGNNAGITSTRKRRKKKERKRKKKEQSNPFVMDIDSLGDLKEEVVETEKDAVLFVSAPYCKLCRQINPLYTRMGRISKEEKESDVLFLKASSAGKEGKQLTFTFGIESVPTFLLFKAGKKYGDPFGVVKLPSKKLDAAIKCLESGDDFPYEKIGMDTKVRRTKLK